jgi:branched-chain amino acid transport system substrate-binding protein
MRKAFAFVIAMALALAAVGCGSDDSDEGQSGGSSTTQAADGPSGEPVKIGLINQETETIAFPELSAAAQAATDYLNAEEGGVDGRPLELVVCKTGDTAESAVACANDFANDDSVPLVINATYNTAATTKILKNRKALINFNVDIPDMTTEGVFTFDAGVLVPLQAMVDEAKADGVSTVSMLYTDDAETKKAIVPLVEALADQQGIEIVNEVPVGDEPDLTAALTAADPDSVDGLLMLLLSEPQCVPMGDAVQTLGVTIPIYSAEICASQNAVESGSVNDWKFTLTNLGQLSLDADPPEATTEFRRILDEYSDGEPNLGSTAGFGFAHVVAVADLYEQTGVDDLTPVAITQTLTDGWSFDPIPFPPLECPGPEPFVGACENSVYIGQAVDGQLVLADPKPITVDPAEFEFVLEG